MTDVVLVAGGIGRRVMELLRAHDVPVRVIVRSAPARHRGGRPRRRPPGVLRAQRVPDHLLAATVMATVAKEHSELDVLVDMSQMTVSQMTATSAAESHQQRLHWLAEQVFDWSRLPVVHVRPTSFLDNPLFTTLAARSIRGNGTLALPFGTGRTSPVAAEDVARVVATILRAPGEHVGNVYELTGPQVLDPAELAGEFATALGRPVSSVDVPWQQWREQVLAKADLPAHTEQHIATMAKLHRENRYDRFTDRRDLYLDLSATTEAG